MSEKPVVKPGDTISVGSQNAIVCTVYSDSSFADLEIVFLGYRNRAINDFIVWNNNHWAFKNSSPSGGYADKSERLKDYVAKLRSLRYR